jgi:ketosteroid isomerase-like protein
VIEGRALADANRSAVVMEHERIVRSLLDAFNRRDLEGVLQLLHPQVTLRTVSALIFGDGLPYNGHEGIRRYFGDVERHWVEPVHVRGAGEAVAALGVVKGRGRAPEFVLRDVPTSWLVRFRDGLVFELRVFSDRRAFEEVLTRALANRIEAERALPDAGEPAPGSADAARNLDRSLADLAVPAEDVNGGEAASTAAARLSGDSGSAE